MAQPRGRHFIVPLVMDRDAIQAERCTMYDIDLAAGLDVLSLLQWLATRNLIMNHYLCATCNVATSLTQFRRKSDGYMWRCNICKSLKSVRDRSFFGKSKLHLRTLIQFIYCWARDMPQMNCALESGLGPSCTRTTVDWANFCRDVCKQWIEQHPCVIGGLDDNGLSKTVEIDESKFFHRKYHRGLWREGHWVFGGIERESKKCFLVEVPDRTEATLTPIIRRHILPGTIIISDGWPSYRNISAIDGGIYEHNVVVHERNFVDPDDTDTHTQNVENMWMRAKRKIRQQYGTSEALFESYLSEFLWRNSVGNRDVFATFLQCISDVYPLD